MDHNNKHLLPGFQFPTAFAGLANVGTGTNASLLSALSQLGGLPTAAILPTPINPTELAQWAAAAQQTNQQAWLDQAKVAAMLPSLYLSSVADVKNLALAQQTLQTSVVNGTSSSTIFPNLIGKLPPTKLISPPKADIVESPSANEPLSNASSSHLSSSTPQEIDVGGVYSQIPQTLAFDLSTKTASPVVGKTSESTLLCEPSTSASSILTSVLPASSDAMAQRVMTNAELDLIDPADLIMFEKRPKEIQRSQSELMLPTIPATIASAPPSAPPIKRNPDEEMDDHDVTQEIFNNFPTEADDGGVFGLFGDGTNDGGLSPIQFTPPDSPTGLVPKEEPITPVKTSAPTTPFTIPTVATSGQNSSQPHSSAFPSTSISRVASRTDYGNHNGEPSNFPDSFKAPVGLTKSIKRPFVQSKSNVHSKTNKIPIYKQKRLGNFKMDSISEKDVSGDAYSFEDEEENSILKISKKDALDQEVKEKLSRLAGQSGDKNKNVYVPGVGFAVPQEQPQQDLWRNVVLKKRPVENRPTVPSANLLPASAHAEACQAAARLAEPEIVTLAESLRRRKKARYVCSFIKTEAVDTKDITAFKEEGIDYGYNTYNAPIDAPKLPKLVIKLPRKSEEIHEKKKKKKKRKREEEDSDWEGERRSKKHKHKKKKLEKLERKDSGYEIRFVERDPYEEDIKPDINNLPPVKEEINNHHDVPVNRKKRLMQQWQEEEDAKTKETKLENGLLRFNGVEGRVPNVRKPFPEFNGDAIKKRLSKFSQADGNVTKGCFVVNKSELFREDCALWKVDNPNMLQKFPPRIDATTKNVTYKSSSTYSGWCEQISSGYYKVAIRFIKQSRSESIVEPEVPLSDLFPAMTTELSDNNGFLVPEEEGQRDPNEHVNFLRDQRRMSLYILNREVVDHALTLEHLQVLKEKNDWNFLKALTDVDKLNNECMNKLRTNTNIKEEFEDLIKDYSKMVITDTNSESSGFICLHCQACKFDKRPVDKIIQLLGRQGYDRETLQYADKIRLKPREDDEEDFEPLIATELYFCDSCATAAQQFHRCYHMMFDLLRFSEEKLESLGTINSEFKPETIVELAKKSRNWQNRVFSEILDMWKKIEASSPTLAPSTVHSIAT